MTFEEITKEMNSIYIKKNNDYGNSFDKSCDEFGLVSPAIRMTDKLNRFKSLIKTRDEYMVKDESIKDTLLDLANYAILTYMYVQNKLTM